MIRSIGDYKGHNKSLHRTLVPRAAELKRYAAIIDDMSILIIQSSSAIRKGH